MRNILSTRSSRNSIFIIFSTNLLALLLDPRHIKILFSIFLYELILLLFFKKTILNHQIPIPNFSFVLLIPLNFFEDIFGA